MVTSAAPVVLDVLDPARVPVVVLGAGLYPDGSIRPVLDARLRAAKTIADRYPTAPLIVSGGVPRSGVTEGAAMTRWLTSHGVPPDRISTEQTSTSTASNAACVAPMLAAMNAYAAVVVTTADHLPRALVEFRLATGGARPIFGAAAL
ncbi:YdcF family protein [Rhodococcus kroppenstedtii]|nr:YdcF family protein [Rhodococcus kroppenstedtii]